MSLKTKEALTKQRFVRSYKKKKAILLMFLLIVDIFIWNGVIDTLDNWDVQIVERHASAVQAVEKVRQSGSEEAQPLPSAKEIAKDIYQRESSSGVNNYSKCEAVGKVNNIGYAIPGDGTYRCFDSHQDEMKVLEGWIIDKQAQNMSMVELMCLYSGNNYNICN